MAVRRSDPTAYPHGVVYICFGHDGQIVYIGQTSDWRRRASQHRNQTEWWGEVALVGTIPARVTAHRLDLEKRLIEAHKPPRNGTGPQVVRKPRPKPQGITFEQARALVASWPELTPEQKDRLAVLLRPAEEDTAA